MTSDMARQARAAGTSLSEAVLSQLKADIVACRVLPGEMLAAQGLAERFGVSQSPVHEALKSLCRDGFLRVVPRVGYIVTPVSVSDIDEIFDLRLSLEVLGAGLAAERATDEEVAGLQAQHARAQANLGSMDDPAYLESLMAGNRDFHTTVAALSGNHRLHRIVGGLLDEGQRIYFLYFRARRPALLLDPHVEITRALAAHDPVAARRAMTTHIEDMRDGTHMGSGQP